MIREINPKKTRILSNEEESKIFGGFCPIGCGCNTNCGSYEAFRLSKDDSGFIVPEPQ